MATKRQRYSKTSETGTFLKPLRVMNAAQEHYMNMMREMTVTFCTGPAGTAKTYLATYIALEALLVHRSVKKVILTRPIVAVEDIGYLPGDMQEKIHPYVLPLLDAIEDHVGPTKTKDLIENGFIDIVPLAYMRGRSLNEAFLVLDESQNTTKEQMKMFLTRLGYDSKMVITGDLTQNDLPRHIEPGLGWAVEQLRATNSEIGVVEFAPRDIVRNPLIGAMLQHLDGVTKTDIRSDVVDKDTRRENTLQRMKSSLLRGSK
jgi:phosphate starvation-inducible PhoH-like protein